MKQLPLLVLGFACSEPPPIEHATRNSAPVALSDPARLARWHELAPTGLTWPDVVERIPKAERAAMAFALVRDGKTTCPRTTEECGMTSVDSARDDEGIDDPCLRRALVHHLIANAGRTVIPPDVLAALAHSHDADMIDVTANALDDSAVAGFLVEVEATGTVAPSGVLAGRPHAVVVDAARRHIDAAISELSSDDDRDLLIAAIADTAIDPTTRASILLGSDFPSSQPLRAALAIAVADPHCELSARAATALARLGDPSHLPRGPVKRDVKAFLHEACRLVGADPWDESSSLVATFVTKSGLVVTAPRGREFADTQAPFRETWQAGEDREGSEIYVLLRTLGAATCTGDVCIGETARYDLGWSGSKLARVTIMRDLAKETIAAERMAACDPGGGD